MKKKQHKIYHLKKAVKIFPRKLDDSFKMKMKSQDT